MRSSRIPVSFVLSLLWVISTNAAPVKGVVIDPGGAAVSGCRVTAYALEGTEAQVLRYESDKPDRKSLASATSNAAGEFSIDVPAERVFQLQFEAEKFAPAATPVANGEDIGAVLLTPAPTKVGSLRAKGKPVAGARVIYIGAAEMITVTDTEGKFRVADPGLWSGRVIVIHPDFAIVDLTRQGAQLPVSFDLNAGVHVTGVVSGSDGKTPAAGARINIGGWNLGESSADGSFDVTRAPANAIEVLAYAGKTSGRATRKGSDKLVIRLMPDASLRGRVIDIKRKSPLSGASISFRPAQSFFRMGFSFSVVSGSKGDFVFDRIAPGVYEVDVTLPGYSISHRTITIPAGASLSSDLTAVRSGVLSGTVVDEDKRVVPGAPIMMVEKNYPIFFGSEAKAYSDPGGRYLVRAVEPDHELVAMVRKSGEPEARSTAFRLAPGERRDKMIITIPRGLTLRGKVVDVAGKPLAAVRIIASAQTENSQWEWPEMLRSWEDGRLTPQTEPDGTFSLRLKEATYLVGFRLPGYALQEARNVRVDRDLEPLKIVMERGASISGRVQHAGTGTPVAEAYVLIPEQPMPPVITAADGSFTINDLEPGEMLIRASKPQESVSVQKQVTAPSENVVMEVPRGETISGRVLARSSGSPVTDFQAGLRTGRMVLAPLTIHSADGTFTLDNVMVGSIDLVITAPGFVAKRVRGLNVEEGKPIKDLEVLVEPGVHLSGTVTGPDDEALSDVYIQAQKKDSGANTEDLGYSGVPRTSTDNAGTFSLDALEPGEKIVIFRKQGFATERRAVNLEGKDARVDVKLSKGHMLQGRVITSEGAPVADAQVNAYAPGSESYSSAKTDAGGQFTLEGLSALRYTVEAQKTGFASTSKKDIDAATVTSLELVLDRGARVHGAVRGATRKQLDQATVSARGGRSFSESPVSGDGTFRMEGVATGTVKVALDISGTGGSRSVPPKTIEVAAGADVEVNFDLQPGSVVRGRVTLEGKAVSTGEVSFGSTEPGVNSYGSAPTDENGAYEITGLTPGKFRVTVMDTTRYSSMYSGSHEVTGSETFDIEVRSAAVRGRVVDLDSGKGIDGALVTLDSLDSLDVPTRSRISVATSPNGEFVLSGVPEGGYKAIAQKEHYAEGISEVTVDAGGSQPIELKMQLAEGLLVRVVDRRDSRPLDARFFVNDSLGSLVFDRGRDSPASDTARISLPEGRYSLSVSVYGFATRTVDLQIPSPDVLIALSPGGSLVITSSATEGRVGQLVNASGKPYQRSLYRPDGKFEIKSGTTTIESIESGAYVLRVYDNKGKVENTRPVVIKEGETTAAGL